MARSVAKVLADSTAPSEALAKAASIVLPADSAAALDVFDRMVAFQVSAADSATASDDMTTLVLQPTALNSIALNELVLN
jgi:hypothetical protein